MLPDLLLANWLPLQRNVACLSDGHLQHQAAAVVCNAAHDIQAPRGARDQQLVIPTAAHTTSMPVIDLLQHYHAIILLNPMCLCPPALPLHYHNQHASHCWLHIVH
jgi:hypothetical protein